MRLIAFLALLLAAAPAAAQPPGERAIRTRDVAAAFAGWERGDYLWAHFVDGRRRRVSAMLDSERLGAFLEARRGRPVVVTIATVRATLPEAGRTTIRRVTGARDAAGSADAWWRRLSPAQRRAALARFERAVP